MVEQHIYEANENAATTGRYKTTIYYTKRGIYDISPWLSVQNIAFPWVGNPIPRNVSAGLRPR